MSDRTTEIEYRLERIQQQWMATPEAKGWRKLIPELGEICSLPETQALLADPEFASRGRRAYEIVYDILHGCAYITGPAADGLIPEMVAAGVPVKNIDAGTQAGGHPRIQPLAYIAVVHARSEQDTARNVRLAEVLAAGCDAQAFINGDAGEWYGPTPLYITLAHSNLPALELLLKAGADPNACPDPAFAPPAMYLLGINSMEFGGYAQALRILMAHGLDPELQHVWMEHDEIEGDRTEMRASAISYYLRGHGWSRDRCDDMLTILGKEYGKTIPLRSGWQVRWRA